jgi:hypothetical protein
MKILKYRDHDSEVDFITSFGQSFHFLIIGKNFVQKYWAKITIDNNYT